MGLGIGIGLSPTLGQGVGVVDQLRAASTKNRVNTSYLAAGGGTRRFTTRSFNVIGSGSFDYLKVLLNNIAWSTTTGPTSPGNAITIANCFIQIDGQAVKRVTFGGSNSVTLSDGQKDVLSDPILPSLFGKSTFDVGDQYYVDTDITITGSQKCPNVDTDDNVEGNYFDPAVITPTFGPSGISFTGGTPTASLGFKSMLVGKFHSGDPYTWAGLGDSIFTNGNSQSYFIRALSVGHLAGMQIGRVGGIADSVSPAGLSLLKYCSGAIEEYNTNDAALSLSQLQTKSLAAWANARAAAALSKAGTPFKLVRTGLLLLTTGTFTTTAGQTVSSGWGSGGTVEQFNDWCASEAGAALGPDVYIDVSSAIRASPTKGATDYYKWATGPLTSDGEHPNPTAATSLGTLLAAGLPT